MPSSKGHWVKPRELWACEGIKIGLDCSIFRNHELRRTSNVSKYSFIKYSFGIKSAIYDIKSIKKLVSDDVRPVFQTGWLRSIGWARFFFFLACFVDARTHARHAAHKKKTQAYVYLTDAHAPKGTPKQPPEPLLFACTCGNSVYLVRYNFSSPKWMGNRSSVFRHR